jgi:mycofactocin precursor
MKDGEEREPEGSLGEEADSHDPDIIEEIEIEDFAVDGICGVY